MFVANLATLLARQGKQVLVLDENTKGNVSASFGAVACYDLLDVINRERSVSDVLLSVAPGVRVLPAAQAVRKLGKFGFRQQEALHECFRGIDRPVDVILVDASDEHPLGFSPLGLASHDTIVVVPATSAAITECYALIKKVALAYAHKRFRILVNKVRTPREAKSIYETIARVARTRGVATLDYAGFMPQDPRLVQAAKLCQPVSALFPESPSAKAFQQIGADLLEWPCPENNLGGVEQFVQQLLHLSQHIDPVAIYA